MGKKVREYKSGDFIFAKVKGYPAWPARVQRLNGKKYFVYFYGTGETANLPPNMIFDYAENKDKFLTKTVKRRDFNDGVKQIEYDFANNVPLEQVIGVPMVEVAADGAVNDTANDSAIDATMDESAADTTANDTVADDTVDDSNQNDGAVEDSDDAGALVIDEGKAPPAKGRKPKTDTKTPAKETPKPKEPKTPRGKAKKEDEEKTVDEELVSRSGRKIRPKRYIDEQTEENATLPSPAPKRRRGASPPPEKEKVADGAKEKDAGKSEKTSTQFNAVKQSELEGLKEPFKPADEDKDNILIAYLPSGTYVGIKLFQCRPTSFKSEAVRLQWDKQAAANAITLKMQLERDQITPQSVQGQLVMDLNLTDEEKSTLDKERETEEKKSRVNFLKTEMKLIELDAKIKTCLCLEKADTELCLKLLDELLTLEVKPLMLLKHPTCLETVKRMRAYVGNTPSWDLSESAALVFSKQAHRIRKKADMLYKGMKEHFQTPDGLSFWEYFSERVLVFKKVTSNLNASELLEMVHVPLELSQPNAHTMRAAIDEANNCVPPLPDCPQIDNDEEKQAKKKGPPGKAKKSPVISFPFKSKRQSSRNKVEEDKTTKEPEKPEETPAESDKIVEEKSIENDADKEKNQEDNAETVSEDASNETPIEPESAPQDATQDVEMAEPEKAPETDQNSTEKEVEATPKESEASEANTSKDDEDKPSDKETKEEKPSKDEKNSKKNKKSKETEKSEQREKSNESENIGKESKTDKNAKESDKSQAKSPKDDKHSKDAEKSSKDKKSSKDSDKSSKDVKNGKESEKSGKEKDDKSEGNDKDEKEKQESGEPRAKRSRESKKTEPPPPRSPAKRKSKF